MLEWGEGSERGRVRCLKGGMLQFSDHAFAAFFTEIGAWVSFLALQSIPFSCSLPLSNST